MMLGQWRIKVFFLHQENLPFCNSWCKMDGDGRNVGSPESRASRRKNIPSKGLQRYSWDCGIACVYMILGFKRRLNSGGSHVLSYSEFLGLVIKDRRREHQKASKSNSFWTMKFVCSASDEMHIQFLHIMFVMPHCLHRI